MIYDDTIAAISTAPGEGGIGIVRISGSEALSIISKIFKGSKQKNIKEFKTFTIRYGYIYNPEDGSTIDEVLVSYMKAPNTYTREDIVEINCHGGSVTTKRILEVVLNIGARLAEPGEFTKRAFLNGRIDLSQAEAVIDLIRSKTEMSAEAAIKQLEGSLGKKLSNISDMLIEIMSHIEASIDFPEDDIDSVIYTDLERKCKKLIDDIGCMVDTAATGRIIREGLNTVIVGKPNVGKSSLLNALVEENRAIVTDIPGTTRDIIQEYLNIRGIPVNIVDTAGVRETADEIERIGVEKTKEYFRKADLVIFMIDSSVGFSEEDRYISSLINDKKKIILLNKADLPSKINKEQIKSINKDCSIIEMSLKNGFGVDKLKDTIYNFVYSGKVSHNSEDMVTNVRHKNLLNKARMAMHEALKTLNSRLPLDLVSIDINAALEYIGEITGRSVKEDILDKIFSEFCIGK